MSVIQVTSTAQVRGACRWLETILRSGLEGGPVQVAVTRQRRSDEQSRKMWAMLGDVARQVEWHGQRLDKEAWKDMVTAALKRQRVVPGLEGGFVVLGTSTRRMTKPEMSEMIEFLYAFGAEHGVRWTDEEKLS